MEQRCGQCCYPAALLLGGNSVLSLRLIVGDVLAVIAVMPVGRRRLASPFDGSLSFAPLKITTNIIRRGSQSDNGGRLVNLPNLD